MGVAPVSYRLTLWNVAQAPALHWVNTLTAASFKAFHLGNILVKWFMQVQESGNIQVRKTTEKQLVFSQRNQGNRVNDRHFGY